MKHFVLLIFSDADEVADTKLIRADSLIAARQIAQTVMVAWPIAAGFQIWQDGVRLHSTFPQGDEARRAPMLLVAYKRKAGGRR